MAVDLVEAAGVVAYEFELGEHITDIPFLLDLLVEEPLEERLSRVIFLGGRQIVDGADSSRNFLFMAETRLEDLQR